MAKTEIGESFMHRNVLDDSLHIGVKFNPQAIAEHHVLHTTIGLIADKIAERYVAEHYQDVVQHLNPEAIASLVAASAAAEIAHTLKQDTPARVERIVRKEVYQRGVMGGIKRIL